MTDAATIAGQLAEAGQIDTERKLIGELQQALRAEEATLTVEAGLKSGGTANLMSVPDASAVAKISITVNEGGRQTKIGPFTPQDAEAYYALFRE